MEHSSTIAGNFFSEAGTALIAALDRHERERDPARLLDGSESELTERWAGSAVKLKDHAGWLVVPGSNPVRVASGGRQVRAFDGGVFGGRPKYYGMAWLVANADAVALGSLTLADGAGSRSTFRDGLTGDDTKLVAENDSTDGQ